MADLYKERQLQIPEDLPELLPEIDNRQNIYIEKKMYGKNSMQTLIDGEFNEIVKPKKKDVAQFYKLYRELFYDIPQEGDKSHTSLILESTDYVNNFEDPRDKEIEDLEAQIDELTEQVEELKIPKEHPWFPNGTVLSKDGGGAYFLMDEGKKRKIIGGRPARVWTALKQALGYKADDDDFKSGAVRNVPAQLVENLKEGPPFDWEDLYGGKEETIEEKVTRLTSTKDLRLDPSLFGSTKEWLIAVDKEAEEEFALERNLEQRYYKIKDDMNYGNAEERAEAKEQKPEAKAALNASRDRLITLKELYSKVVGFRPGGVLAFTNNNFSADPFTHMNMDQIQEIWEQVTEEMDDRDPEELAEDRRQFVGYSDGKEGLGWLGREGRNFNVDRTIS